MHKEGTDETNEILWGKQLQRICCSCVGLWTSGLQSECTAGLVLAKTPGRNSISSLRNLKQSQMLFPAVDFPPFMLSQVISIQTVGIMV